MRSTTRKSIPAFSATFTSGSWDTSSRSRSGGSTRRWAATRAARKAPSIRRSRSTKFLVEHAVNEALARLPGRKPWELVCLDPACGSGHFLVEYVNYVAARCEELDDRRSYPAMEALCYPARRVRRGQGLHGRHAHEVEPVDQFGHEGRALRDDRHPHQVRQLAGLRHAARGSAWRISRRRPIPGNSAS